MCGDYNLRREKRYVGVDVRFTPDGKMHGVRFCVSFGLFILLF